MNPLDYQRLAARTECDQKKSLVNIIMHKPDLIAVRALHSVVGLSGEVGELSGAVERWIYYGQPFDTLNVKEEIGDCLWYLAQMCNVIGADMNQIMTANIAKLRKRYQDKFEEKEALEENRDRQAEADCMRVAENYPMYAKDVEQYFESKKALERSAHPIVAVESKPLTTGCVACDTGGNQCSAEPAPHEESDAMRFIRHQTGNYQPPKLCPQCGGPISDGACIMAAEGGRPLGCPNCGAVFHSSELKG